MGYPNTILTKTIRRGIMCGFIFLFFIITPLIILYTAGYRYDWKNKEIQQTGVISIDVQPRDVRVLLSNVPTQKRMPLRLANRAPGTYHLTIEKFGYKTWEKDITVNSKQTTYIKNVTLFREQTPVPLFNDSSMSSADSLVSSNDGAYLVATKHDGKIFTEELVHTQTNKKTVLKKSTSDTVPTVLWSPWNDAGIIITTIDDKQVIDLFDPSQDALVATQTLPANSRWQWDKNNIGVYFEENTADGRAIVHLDGSGAFQSAKLTDSASAWYVDSSDSVWTYYPEERAFRKNSGLPILTTAQNIEEIVDVNEDRIIAKTASSDVVIKLSTGEAQQLFTPLAVYNKNTREWLAWSSSELWSLYADGNAVLLDRRQEEILYISPLDQYGVLLINTPSALYGFNPGYAVTQELVKVDSIIGSGVNQRQKKIYFLGSINGKKDLYVLSY